MSKPSWDDAPDWAQWLVKDVDDYWYWYESKPAWVDHISGWQVKSGRFEPVSFECTYQSTLECRP